MDGPLGKIWSLSRFLAAIVRILKLSQPTFICFRRPCMLLTILIETRTETHIETHINHMKRSVNSIFLKLGSLPASNGNRGGSGRGRGGARGGSKRQPNQPEMSEADKNKVKLYKHKYEKYLKLRPTTNSPFDILVKAAQV